MINVKITQVIPVEKYEVTNIPVSEPVKNYVIPKVFNSSMLINLDAQKRSQKSSREKQRNSSIALLAKEPNGIMNEEYMNNSRNSGAISKRDVMDVRTNRSTTFRAAHVSTLMKQDNTIVTNLVDDAPSVQSFAPGCEPFISHSPPLDEIVEAIHYNFSGSPPLAAWPPT